MRIGLSENALWRNNKTKQTGLSMGLEKLYIELTKEYGKGGSLRSLHNFRQFYLEFPEFKKSQTRSANLNWSH